MTPRKNRTLGFGPPAAPLCQKLDGSLAKKKKNMFRGKKGNSIQGWRVQIRGVYIRNYPLPETPKVLDPKTKMKNIVRAKPYLRPQFSRKIYGICSSHARSARSFRRECGDISWIFQEFHLSWMWRDVYFPLCPKIPRWGGGGASVVRTIPCRPRWIRRVLVQYTRAIEQGIEW